MKRRCRSGTRRFGVSFFLLGHLLLRTRA
jgi:hypothetical protein